MRRIALFRSAVMFGLAAMASAASANQTVTYHYDARGRLIAVIYSGTGAPNGCTVYSSTWGTGTLGCMRWSS
jgi:hypothetical protein